jgi:hypothetical protein
MRIPERIRTWRRDAAVFRDYGDIRTADVLERLASELEHDLEENASEIVDMARAVDLTGYTRGHLRRLLLGGTLRNVGTPDNPAFHISDLPRKPGCASPRPRLAPSSPPLSSSRVQVARAVVSGD